MVTYNNKGIANFGPWESLVRTLIIIWFFLFTLNAVPDLHPRLAALSWKVSHWISFFFVLEYLARIIFAKSWKNYLFSGMGIVDFLVCIPFISQFFGADFTVLNSLRIVRVLAIIKVLRFNKTIAAFRQAFMLVKVEFLVFISVITFLLYVTGLGIFLAEHDAQPEQFHSFLDGVWFAVETLTTVGYGDLVPITWLGRVFTSLIMLISVAIIAISTGLMTSAFTRVWQEKKPFKVTVSDNDTETSNSDETGKN